MKGSLIKLSERQILWLKNHFKHTKNEDICQRFGISLSALHRIRRKFGLKKSHQFMVKAQAEATAAAQIAASNENYEQQQRRKEIARQNSIKGRFKQGQWALANKTTEQLAEITKKRVATWKESRRVDEIRLNFGLDQRTKFKFPKMQDPHKQQQVMGLRYNMRRNGYVFPKRGGMVAYITPETHRSKKQEDHARKFGILIKE